MGLFRRKPDGDALVADPPEDDSGSGEELLAEIARLTRRQSRPAATAPPSGGCCGCATAPGSRLLDVPARRRGIPSRTPRRCRERRRAAGDRAADVTPGPAARRDPARRLRARARARGPRRRARARGGDRPRLRRRASRSPPGARTRTGYYEEFEPEPAVRRRRGAAAGSARAGECWRSTRRWSRSGCSSGSRPPGCRRWSAATSASRRCSRPQDDAAQGRARRSVAPGTRTARSWATCARSTSGSRCRAAATRRPGSTSSRGG